MGGALLLLAACAEPRAVAPGGGTAASPGPYAQQAAIEKNWGDDYREGRSVPQNYAEAERRYRRAAALGSADAMASLGDFYRIGYGAQADPAQAALWYRRAIDAGPNLSALNNLALLYETGRGVNRDMDEAVRLYLWAASAGNTVAMVNMGNLYATGRGVPRNDTEAVRWYRMAAERGDVAGERNLGLMYLEGRGVPKDFEEAQRWLQMAAPPKK